MNFTIRPGTKADFKDIWRLLKDLAIHEKMLDEMIVTYEELERDAFSQEPWFESLLAEVPEENKEGFKIVGLAVYFYTYSTWKGRSVYLEDLYVMPEFRGFGIGKNLLSTLAKVVKEKHCVQLELSVLGQNNRSRAFYSGLGAQDITLRDGWHSLRFDAQSLKNVIL
ncbi:thialysine N-epsilon-acetyltransferase-like [Corythoichthys intestinalis]|uniref:thialysine N-epsilon-acetyltransferase-like n=1 Tax=Corythoichthys intestinalis TaxID=161448 RepID=UPI0025A6106D|nr:thialysine N-epsilon-acetyltransferase-like [Corythoichthys intestinalis]XP_061801208.1 thialysine N-epsilon-acetyltransferase-like [Nerophis lumbriciformis]